MRDVPPALNVILRGDRQVGRVLRRCVATVTAVLLLVPVHAAAVDARRVSAEDLENLRGLVLEERATIRLQAAVPPGGAEEVNELLVWVRAGVDAWTFALARGLTVKAWLVSDPGMFVCRFASTAEAFAARNRLKGDPGVRRVYWNGRMEVTRTAFVPNDPYFSVNQPEGFPGQWHLKNQFNQGPDVRIEGAWARNLTGAGVLIGITDDGVERSHPDLAPNYDLSHSFDFSLRRAGAAPVHDGPGSTGDNHGTAVAGVAAARGGNGIGVTGAAPLARLAGQRLDFEGGFTAAHNVDAIKYRAVGAAPAFKIKNHSYGNPRAFGSLDQLLALHDAFSDSARAGVIHVLSAGNERGRPGQDSNKTWSNTPDAIVVGALSSSSVFSSYSSFGAHVFITAPSSSFRQGELGTLSPRFTGIVTTDRQGTTVGYTPGENDNTFPDTSYTSDFGGTSSSAPLVTGVLALAAQANPAMDVRLAKHLLARSAELIHPDDSPGTMNSHARWQTNAAGFKFNPNYGFGLIQADALTRLATEFSGVTPREFSATPLVNVGAVLTDATTLSRQIDADSTVPVESVEVFLDLTHPVRGDLEAYLTSPSGTTSRLFVRSAEAGRDIRWWFITHAFWGENPEGTWTLEVADLVTQGTGGAWNAFLLVLHHGEPIPVAESAPPRIGALAPDSGPVGADVTISGSKFTSASAVRFNGVSAGFTVSSAQEIRATVPVGATTGPVTVTTPDGTATSPEPFTVNLAPFISSFAPTNGPVGTTVVLTGVNFADATAVDFNGAPAAFTVDSSTQITATVPGDATTGRVRVSNAAGSGSSHGSFAVNNEPSVLAFAPTAGGEGTPVVITGGNLATASAVRFGGVNAAFTVDSATRVTATVPPGAVSGPIEITTTFGTVSSAAVFTVILAPVIHEFAPTTAASGDAVVITGQRFLGASEVRFNGISADSFSVDTDQRLTVIVPDGATSGPITVHTPGGAGTSPASFTVMMPPEHDFFADARPLTGASGSDPGTNRGATIEPGEPAHGGGFGGRSVWYQWAPPASGVWMFDTLGSDFDTVLAVYDGETLATLTSVAANDDAFGGTNSAVVFQAESGRFYRLAVDGFNTDTNQPASAPAGSIQLNWRRLEQAPVVSSFTPPTGVTGTVVTLRGNHFEGAQAVNFNGAPADGFTVLSPGEIVATVPAGATTGPVEVLTLLGTGTSGEPFTIVTTPANDAFAMALSLPNASGSVMASNAGASKEPGEPDHAGNRGGRSVWYRWVAPASGVWTFDTIGSDFDTLLAVYTGDTIGTLALVAANDNFDPTRGVSRITFTAQSGGLYRIAVDGFGGLAGRFRLNYAETPDVPGILNLEPASGPPGTTVTITGANLGTTTAVRFNVTLATEFNVQSSSSLTAVVPPGAASGPVTVSTPHGQAASAASFMVIGGVENDAWANARLVAGNAWIEVGDTALATIEPGEPPHAGNAGGRSVWFRWQAPSDGFWTLNTHGSAFDTVLAVYTGNTLSSLALLAASDDADNTRTSRLEFAATAGVTYHVALDGFAGAGGRYEIRMLERHSPTTIFATGFEPAEGYVAGQPLVGQGGWIKAGSGGDGVVSDYFPAWGQQAYIGFNPPDLGTSATFLGRPLVYSPSAGSTRVRFSTLLAIVDSTNFFYDDFRWTFYNSDFENLVVLAFDNLHLGIYYDNFDGAGFRNTGVRFTNQRIYFLEVLMDFERNRWSAWLDGATLVLDAILVAGNAQPDLRGIDATWILGSAGLPGNNYLLFDEYRVVAEPSGEPRIQVSPADQTVRRGGAAVFTVVAAGEEPLRYQWHFDGTELPGATNAVLRLGSVFTDQTGEYSVVVSNPTGAASSNAAMLAVTELAPPRVEVAGFDTAGGLELVIEGNVGTVISIEASTNLVHWFEVGAGIQSGSFRFVDPVIEPSQRFYRVREFDP